MKRNQARLMTAIAAVVGILATGASAQSVIPYSASGQNNLPFPPFDDPADMADGQVDELNGYAANKLDQSQPLTVTFDFTGLFNVIGFDLYNDINFGAGGMSAYTLEFFDANGAPLGYSASANIPATLKGETPTTVLQDHIEFATAISCAAKAVLTPTAAHNGGQLLEIREAVFLGTVCELEASPEPELIIIKDYTHPIGTDYVDYEIGATFPITVQCVDPSEASNIQTFVGSITSVAGGTTTNQWTILDPPLGWICTATESQPTDVDTLPNGTTCQWQPEAYVSPNPVTIAPGVNAILIKNNYSCSSDPPFDLDIYNISTPEGQGVSGCGNGDSFIKLQNVGSVAVDTTILPIQVVDSKPIGSTICGYGPTVSPSGPWSCTPTSGAGPASCTYVAGGVLQPFDSIPPLQIFWNVVPGTTVFNNSNCAEIVSPDDGEPLNDKSCYSLN